jgi:hypothetical protein
MSRESLDWLKRRRYSKSNELRFYLRYLFKDNDIALDHDPALCNRKFNIRTGKYTPDANDPDYLVYRTEQAHDTKTRIVGERGQYSDLALRRKNKRIARNRDRTRPRAKIKQRKTIWPKRQFGRKKNERAHHSKSTKQAATRLPYGSL